MFVLSLSILHVFCMIGCTVYGRTKKVAEISVFTQKGLLSNIVIHKATAVQLASSVQQSTVSLHVINTFASLSQLICAKIRLLSLPCSSVRMQESDNRGCRHQVQHFLVSWFLLWQLSKRVKSILNKR